MNTKKDHRKAKNRYNHDAKRFKIGAYMEDCRYHPCIITERYFPPLSYRWAYFDADVSGTSLITGTPWSCSWSHCAPLWLSEQEAKERAAYAIEHGWEAYLRKYIGYDDESMEEWRKQDAQWNYEKTEPR